MFVSVIYPLGLICYLCRTVVLQVFPESCHPGAVVWKLSPESYFHEDESWIMGLWKLVLVPHAIPRKPHLPWWKLIHNSPKLMDWTLDSLWAYGPKSGPYEIREQLPRFLKFMKCEMNQNKMRSNPSLFFSGKYIASTSCFQAYMS